MSSGPDEWSEQQRAHFAIRIRINELRNSIPDLESGIREPAFANNHAFYQRLLDGARSELATLEQELAALDDKARDVTNYVDEPSPSGKPKRRTRPR
ncbi:MAG: hypothetical protein ABL907_17760 [Hyphomicrobium sp.]